MKKQLFKALAATAIVGAVMAMSSVVASAAVYTLNANDLEKTSAATTKDMTAGNGFFTIKQGIQIDGNTKTGPITKTKYTQRIKLGGTSTATTKSITFTLDNPASVVIEAINSSDKDGDRTLSYTKGAEFNANSTTAIMVSNGSSIMGETLELDAGTYTIGTSDKGFNIYGIVVTEKEATEEIGTELTEVANGAVIAVGSDTYIIAAVAKDSEKMDQESITISLPNGTFEPVPTTSKVYETISVNGEDLSLDTNNYYYAIKVTGSKDIKLKDFTVE